MDNNDTRPVIPGANVESTANIYRWLKTRAGYLQGINVETPEAFIKRVYPVGKAFHHEMGKNPDLYHVVGYVEDGPANVIITYKRWSKRYGQWMYRAEPIIEFLDQQADIATYDSRIRRKLPIKRYMVMLDKRGVALKRRIKH